MAPKQLLVKATVMAFAFPFHACDKTPTEGAKYFTPVETFRTIDTEPDWSPDGKTIAYTHLSNGPQVWLLDLESMEKRFLTAGSKPDWSPDSKKVAYEKSGNIYVIDIAGKQTNRLTNWGSCFLPSWSPDGGKIAYVVGTNWPTVPLDSAGIWIMSTDGSWKRQIIRFNGSDPDWSPDGDKLLFTQPVAEKAPYDEVILISLIGSSITRLTNNTFDDRYPSWSPDGSKIAWGSYRGGNPASSGIWVMNADGTNQHQLTKGGGHPSWSPDGTRVVYYGTNWDSNFGTLWMMNADGTDQHPLTLP